MDLIEIIKIPFKMDTESGKLCTCSFFLFETTLAEILVKSGINNKAVSRPIKEEFIFYTSFYIETNVKNSEKILGVFLNQKGDILIIIYFFDKKNEIWKKLVEWEMFMPLENFIKKLEKIIILLK